MTVQIRICYFLGVFMGNLFNVFSLRCSCTRRSIRTRSPPCGRTALLGWEIEPQRQSKKKAADISFFLQMFWETTVLQNWKLELICLLFPSNAHVRACLMQILAMDINHFFNTCDTIPSNSPPKKNWRRLTQIKQLTFLTFQATRPACATPAASGRAPHLPASQSLVGIR